MKYKTLKDHVYDYIGQQIRLGNLQPSSMINETAISEELTISRTPVREALIQLASEGILDNIPRKGFVLKPVTEDEAIALFVVIGDLDALAASLACDRLSEADLSAMELCAESMDLAIKHNNFEMYLDQQNAFHEIYLEACGNPVLIDTLTKLKSKFFKRGYLLDGESQRTEFLTGINLEHHKILEMFKAHDKRGVSDYLINVHWSQTSVHNELFM